MLTYRRLHVSTAALMASCWLLAATCPAFAQTATANINGYVRDASGAVVPNATVTAQMTEQQIVRTAESNSDGFYQYLLCLREHTALLFRRPGSSVRHKRVWH